MPKHCHSISLQIWPTDYDYIGTLAEEQGVTKRAVMRQALRAGLRALLEKHSDASLLREYDEALRKGFEEECLKRADSIRRRWALDAEGAHHVQA
jgi:hypothetical protein